MSYGRTCLLTGSFVDSQQNPLAFGVLTWQLVVDNPGGAPLVYEQGADPATGEFVLPLVFTTPTDPSAPLGAGVGGRRKRAPSDPDDGGIAGAGEGSRTSANVVWWISVNGGPQFPIQVPAAGGYIDDLIVGIDGQGNVVPVVLLAKLTVTTN